VLYEVAVKNAAAQALHGPVYLTIEALSGATVKNATGVTSSNVPYYLLSPGIWPRA